MEQRLIDVNAYLKKVCTYNKTGCGSCKLQTACPADEPTIEAVPISFIEEQAKLCNEVGFARGEECYMALIEDWRDENVTDRMDNQP